METLMKWIDIKPLVELAKNEDCPFIAIIGGKGTGKTYGCIKYALDNSEDFKKPFFYVRRYDKTFTPSICGNLINIHRQDIINMSHGKYNKSYLRGKQFFICRESLNKMGNLEHKEIKPICYCRSLNNVDTETGDDKDEISCIIYDEFLSRGGELRDEYTKLMIVHNNAIRNRTNTFVPMFLLGNTFTKDSTLAEMFGIRMRDIKQGVNIFRNNKGQARIILYYTQSTSVQSESAQTYYDRFENDRINMITHGDWMIGTYPVATQKQLYEKGVNFKFFDRGICVIVTVFCQGNMPFMVIKKPYECKTIMNITPIINKNNYNLIPPIILKCVQTRCYSCETPYEGEDFRDICKHIVNGRTVLNEME